MGYACPVCDTEQADAVHLANHLAVTASLGRQDHSEWLAEYAPDWSDCSPEELGEIVSQYAREIETPGFEDSRHDHDHGRPGSLEEGLARQSRQPGRGTLSADAESVIQEARVMSRRMEGERDADDGATADEESIDDSSA
ncbi:DUF5810 domain-containing protein [Natronorubrum thiooxidans]|uniref:Uncharacterized protein n=1 Tax=Natronorubrum thiooxidans TaxID=308853 RepID=A0A1N7FEX7_9EURY|nr:DUF5810 domain-containing protein [Natronorubrum thiooxidans]SIR98785.1 hypothetical protein SAMN05421752_106253 [Natronorubrum thiooxidans]